MVPSQAAPIHAVEGSPITPSVIGSVPRRGGARKSNTAKEGLSNGALAAIVCLVTAVFVPLFGIVVFALVARPDLFAVASVVNNSNRPVADEGTQNSTNASSADATYADAGAGRKQGLDRMFVKVDRCQTGGVRGRDSERQVSDVTNDRYFAVFLSIENLTKEPVPCQTWYGKTFRADAGPNEAHFEDATGQVWPTVMVPGLIRLDSQNLQSTIQRSRTITDVVVFQIPDGVKPANAAPFRLSLPGEAVDRQGMFRFEIPASMIETAPASATPDTMPADDMMDDSMMEESPMMPTES